MAVVYEGANDCGTSAKAMLASSATSEPLPTTVTLRARFTVVKKRAWAFRAKPKNIRARSIIPTAIVIAALLLSKIIPALLRIQRRGELCLIGSARAWRMEGKKESV